MLTRVSVPKLGLTMEEAVIERWLSAEGDHVEQGAELLEIVTEKVNVVVESPATGYLRKILATPGTTVAVGEVVALITDTADEPLAEEASDA